MDEDEFIQHAKEEHAEEIIDDCMTYSGNTRIFNRGKIMTEIFVKCNVHNKKVHIKDMSFRDSFIGECGCTFILYADIRNLTEQTIKEKRQKEYYIDDHKGKRYQDGSRELQGIMLQDGSYI